VRCTLLKDQNNVLLCLKSSKQPFVRWTLLNEVFIPRINLDTTADRTFPFIMRRRQFPVKVAFAMTINKAQGQSFKRVGIYLSCPVFGHDQLYVAMSRAGIAANTKLFVVNNRNTQGKFEGFEGTYTKNVVYPEVLTAGS